MKKNKIDIFNFIFLISKMLFILFLIFGFVSSENYTSLDTTEISEQNFPSTNKPTTNTPTTDDTRLLWIALGPVLGAILLVLVGAFIAIICIYCRY